jgi:hypothetical protein
LPGAKTLAYFSPRPVTKNEVWKVKSFSKYFPSFSYGFRILQSVVMLNTVRMNVVAPEIGTEPLRNIAIAVAYFSVSLEPKFFPFFFSN